MLTRIFGREDEQELEPVETDEDVRKAMARLERYGSSRLDGPAQAVGHPGSPPGQGHQPLAALIPRRGRLAAG